MNSEVAKYVRRNGCTAALWSSDEDTREPLIKLHQAIGSHGMVHGRNVALVNYMHADSR